VAFDAETEVNRLKNRIYTLEEIINKIQIAITNLATNEALSQILLLKQKDIDNLKSRATALENQVEIIKMEVFK
jgi:polyhydroxyalkanoate synthesis regulator phasin